MVMLPAALSVAGSAQIEKMTIQWRAILPLFLGAAIWLIPVPAGLTGNAWAYFALCVVVITALITEPIPGPVAGLLGITAATTLNLVAANPDDSIRWALSGFSRMAGRVSLPRSMESPHLDGDANNAGRWTQ
jgi:hypothetical protein